jgi:predicted transcriptional regulator
VSKRIAAMFQKQVAKKQRNIAAIARTVGRTRTQVYRVLRAEGLIAPAVRKPAKPAKQGKVHKVYIVSKTK